jgi:hypothetical protein
MTCHGGVNEIDGNNIVVSDSAVRFSFDFGTSSNADTTTSRNT